MIEIPKLEKGLVRVFALSMTDAEAKALKDAPTAPQIALRAEVLDADFTEIVQVSDFGELGLKGYLISGCGIEPSKLEDDAAKLAALDGWVMIVFSRAFHSHGQVLHPVSELTLIGTYAEPGVDWSDNQVLQSESATTPAGSEKSGPSDAAMSGRIATAALAVILFVTLAMIWIAS